MLKSYRSQTHITPLRIRSRSRDKQSTISFTPKDLQEQLDINYIGLRANKAHVSCSQLSYTMVNQKQKQNGGSSSANNLINQMNNDLQRFIDVELKGALAEMKNDMQKQQFSFERQICTVIGKLTSELQRNGIKQDVDLPNYALKSELNDLEERLAKAYEKIEEDLNYQQQATQQQFSEQSSKINTVNLTISTQKKEINKLTQNIQQQIDELQDQNLKINDRFHYYDKQFEQQTILIDKNHDDIDKQLRKVQQEMRNLEIQQNEYEKLNQQEHEEFKTQFDSIEQKLQIEGLTEKLQQLEEIVNNQESLTVINSLVQKVYQIEKGLKSNQKLVTKNEELFNAKIYEVENNIIESQNMINSLNQRMENVEQTQQHDKDILIEHETTIRTKIEEFQKNIDKNSQQIYQQEEVNQNYEDSIQQLQNEIQELRKQGLDFKDIELKDQEQKQLEILLNKLKITFEHDLESLKKELEALKQQLHGNVQRIDGKDLEQDKRLDKLEKIFDLFDNQFKNYLSKNENQYQQLKEEFQQNLISFEQDILQKADSNAQSKDDQMLKRLDELEKFASYYNTELQVQRESLVEMITQHMQNQIVDKENEQSPNKQLKTQQEIMHERLLSEMKKKRLWYLRKTPQDHIIEEIMLQNRCSQERAEQIYLKQLEKKHMLKTPTKESPSRFTSEGARIKGINENIIHATYQDKDRLSVGAGITHMRSLSRQNVDQDNQLRFNQRSQDSSRVSSARQEIMRRPVSPNQQLVEPDYERANQISEITPSKSPARAPYIVIHSPLHESTEKIIVSQKKQQQFNSQQPQLMNQNKYFNLRTNEQVITYNNEEIDFDDDVDVDESNVDVNELDQNNEQIRDNLSMLKINQQRDSGMIERPRSEAYFKNYQDHSRFSQTSGNQFPSERYDILRQNPFSNAQSEKKDLNLTTQKSQRSGKQKLQEVEEDWDGDGDFDDDLLNKVDIQQNNEEKDLDQLQQINDDFHNSQDFEYEGSYGYDYKEDIQSPEKNKLSLVSQNQRNSLNSNLQQQQEDENESWGDVNDYI